MASSAAFLPPVDSVDLHIEHSEAIAIQTPTKLKGRQRLLQSLQRISSSTSLTQVGRRRATSNPYSQRSAFSTLSLASVSSPGYGSSYTSQSTGGPSTAPTSVPASPGYAAPQLKFSSSFASRPNSGTTTPTTMTVPCDTNPGPKTSTSALRIHEEMPDIMEDYFSHCTIEDSVVKAKFEFWKDMPYEIKLAIFRFLRPKELVRVSIVSRSFHDICFDGQLWTSFDASEFYRDIPAESLAKIIVAAGPFVKDLNLRGCVQVDHYQRAEVVVKACRNLLSATLEGCRNFQRNTLHTLLANNERLAHINLTGLTAVNNQTCKVIAKHCPQLESFNVSWCTHMDARGVKAIVRGCPKLRDLRAGEIRGFSNEETADAIFNADNLERLVLSGCSDLDDQSFKVMVHGINPEMDIVEGKPLVAPRMLRHLDLSRCPLLTDSAVKALAYNVPNLEGLQLSGCVEITDDGLVGLLASTPRLTHLDLEELSQLTNSLFSEHLAKSPSAPNLEHLSVSYCEHIGDIGMLPVVKACRSLQSLDMDNTRISDLTLTEVASMVRTRQTRTTDPHALPKVGLRMICYDCPNVTWLGIREILSRNTEIRPSSAGDEEAPTYPTEYVKMNVFYGYVQTVTEHTRRVASAQWNKAIKLEHSWANHMIHYEELGAAGSNSRRRRRRARDAAASHADEEGVENAVGFIGRRRRARSGNICTVM